MTNNFKQLVEGHAAVLVESDNINIKSIVSKIQKAAKYNKLTKVKYVDKHPNMCPVLVISGNKLILEFNLIPSEAVGKNGVVFILDMDYSAFHMAANYKINRPNEHMKDITEISETYQDIEAIANLINELKIVDIFAKNIETIKATY